jgi:hypothetical protein
MPGIGPPEAKPRATVPAVSVAWGLTILKNSLNQHNAGAFVRMILGPVGTAAFNANGPTAISPAAVSSGDYTRLPKVEAARHHRSGTLTTAGNDVPRRPSLTPARV